LMSAVVRVMTVAVGSIALQAVTPVRHVVPMGVAVAVTVAVAVSTAGHVY
jgi:hypothetical protein